MRQRRDGARSIVERRILKLQRKKESIDVEITKQQAILEVMDRVGAPEPVVHPMEQESAA